MRYWIFFHLFIYPKKEVFSKKISRNHFCRAYLFLRVKGRTTTKINVTFFYSKFRAEIFFTSYFFKKNVLSEQMEKNRIRMVIWLFQKPWVAATCVPRVNTIIYQPQVARHLWLPQVSLVVCLRSRLATTGYGLNTSLYMIPLQNFCPFPDIMLSCIFLTRFFLRFWVFFIFFLFFRRGIWNREFCSWL